MAKGFLAFSKVLESVLKNPIATILLLCKLSLVKFLESLNDDVVK